MGHVSRPGNSLYLFGNFLLIQDRDRRWHVEYSVNPSVDPPRIDLENRTIASLVPPDSPLRLSRRKGIYRVEGDSLWLCLSSGLVDSDSVEYPANWNLRDDSHFERIELERVPVELKEVTTAMLPELVNRFCGEPVEASMPIRGDPKRDRAAEEKIAELVDTIHKREFQSEDSADAYELELKDTDRVPLAVLWLTLEVDNGGFDQYLSSGRGAMALDTIRILKMIGAPQTAALLEQAVTVFEGGIPPRDQETRLEQLRRIDLEQSELLSGLDEQFYSCTEDLSHLAVQWLSETVSDRG
jgi:hypothetical protein